MKRDLYFSKPLMNAAGMLGFAPDFRDLPAVGNLMGTFITNPVSLRPRRPTAYPEIVQYPGGLLLHTGLPNPGFESTLKKYAAKWARAELPIIVHLMADRPEETARMVRRLENIENVMAAELGFAPQLTDEIIYYAVEMSVGELPLIINLPFEQVLRVGPRVIQFGAAAVSLAAPRGMLRAPVSPHIQRVENVGNAREVTGRLYGPSLFAQALLVTRDAARAGIPIIGGCGVYSNADASALLEAGALAVQVDAVLWRGNFSPA
jgi:dihydroorotate dehydrogenase (NAD+) catalytic subunit